MYCLKLMIVRISWQQSYIYGKLYIFIYLKMLYIDNLAEIIHIKSFIVPITQPHILMKSIQMAAIFGFCSIEKFMKSAKAGSSELLI